MIGKKSVVVIGILALVFTVSCVIVLQFGGADIVGSDKDEVNQLKSINNTMSDILAETNISVLDINAEGKTLYLTYRDRLDNQSEFFHQAGLVAGAYAKAVNNTSGPYPQQLRARIVVNETHRVTFKVKTDWSLSVLNGTTTDREHARIVLETLSVEETNSARLVP